MRTTQQRLPERLLPLSNATAAPSHLVKQPEQLRPLQFRATANRAFVDLVCRGEACSSILEQNGRNGNACHVHGTSIGKRAPAILSCKHDGVAHGSGVRSAVMTHVTCRKN